MQETFENIIEKLEKQIRIEENIAKKESDGHPITHQYAANCMKVIEKFVKQEADKFGTDTNVGSNGWIPCSERLPEEPEITGDVEEDISNGKLNEYIGMIYGAEKPAILYYAGERCWYDEVSQDYYPVRAWQPLPEPYQSKGE